MTDEVEEIELEPPEHLGAILTDLAEAREEMRELVVQAVNAGEETVTLPARQLVSWCLTIDQAGPAVCGLAMIVTLAQACREEAVALALEDMEPEVMQ